MTAITPQFNLLPATLTLITSSHIDACADAGLTILVLRMVRDADGILAREIGVIKTMKRK